MAQSAVQEVVVSSSGMYDPSNDLQRTEKMELIKHIKSVVGNRGHRMKPLNVVVLGCPGSGKSAFLNTVFTSFRTDCWAERARIGDYGRTGERQVTNNVLWFAILNGYSSATDYYPEEPEVLLPTLIDMQGLEDANNYFNKEFIRGLLNRKIQNGQYMNEIREIYENDKEEFRTVIENQCGQMKVDRVIFVVSGDPAAPSPSNLLNCIHDISRSKRVSVDVAMAYTYDPSNDPKTTEKKYLIDQIKSAVGTRSQKKKPLNVVVLGCPGSGKSAFLNTVFTSFRTDCWYERAHVGYFGGIGEKQSTNHVLSYSSAADYYTEEPDVLLPTFIDVQGLEDAEDSFNKEFIRGLFNGKIKNEQPLKEIRENYENDRDEFVKIIEKETSQMKVDRVIVVVSGDPAEPLPSNLLYCILDMSISERDVPIFGVMTREDKFGSKPEVKDRIRSFLNSLGITEDRFLFMRNYCPDIDNHQPKRYHSTVFPYIDVPVLHFLKQVLSPQLRVINSTTRFGKTSRITDLGFLTIDLTKISPAVLLQIALVLMFLYWISFPSISFHTLNTICADFDTEKQKYNTLTIRGLDGICSAKLKISSFPIKTTFLYIMLTVFVIPYLDSIHFMLHEQGNDITKLCVYAGAVVVVMLSSLLSII